LDLRHIRAWWSGGDEPPRHGQEGPHRPAQAKALLAGVRPRDVAGKTRRRIAADELADLVAVEKKLKTLAKELEAMVKDSGSTLMDMPGVGPIVAGGCWPR
jgi:transposase